MTSTDGPKSIRVMQADSVAAVCTHDRVWLDPAVAALPPRHPDALLVAMKCQIAGATLRGEANGPYIDLEADLIARLALDSDVDGIFL